MENVYSFTKSSIAYRASCIILLTIIYTNCSLATAINQKLKYKVAPSEIIYDSNDLNCSHEAKNYNIKNSEVVCNEKDFLAKYFDFLSCDGEKNEQKTTKYLLYDVNPVEGFNLRRDVYIRMAKLVNILNSQSKETNWILVLPPWSGLYHWTNRNLPQNKLKWSEFFDIKSLNHFVPVIELDTFIKENKWTIDLIYYLKNFGSFDTGKWVEKMSIEQCDQIDSYYKVNFGRFKGYFWSHKKFSSDSLKCVSFQGSISFMAEKIRTDASFKNIKKFMIERAETMLHDSFGDIEHWECRRSMRFAKKLTEKAEEIRALFLNSYDANDKTEINSDWRKTKKYHSTAIGGPYLAVHLRRGDFLYSRKSNIVSLNRVADQIRTSLERLNLTHVFLATDASLEEINEIKNGLENYELIFYRPSDLTELYNFKDGGIAIIDQLVCAHARYFIGTFESTFTFRIQEEREILGFDPATTFNVLCFDKKNVNCESTRWLIKYDDDDDFGMRI